MKLAILGGGESGVGAALLGKQKGWDVFVSDGAIIAAKYRTLLLQNQIAFEEAGHTIDKLLDADEIIKSPGIPYTAPIVQQLQQSSALPLIDEIEFAVRYAKGKIIAVTGSNGKSTTSHLIYHFLREAKYQVALAGNVGYSFAKCLTEGAHDYYVIELSSFQLEGIKKFKPTVACLLNITPDHLDRYNYNMETYAKAKLNMLRNMTSLDYFIYPQEDPIIGKYLSIQKVVPQLYPLSMLSSVVHQPKAGYATVLDDPFPIETKDILFTHNQYNIKAAITAAMLVGLSAKTISTAYPAFPGLPHRIEWCGAPQEVDCYNDSKATNVASTAFALNLFQTPIVWIAGGQDKGNDYTTLLPIVQGKVKALICLGKNNRNLIQAFGSLAIPIHETTQMTHALELALSIARPKEIILLSPSCSSFDLFKNFEDRGNQFREKVKELARQI